jgi:hypothetical protein
MMNLERLKEPFPVNDVSWRIGQAGKNGDRVWAKVLAYLDNRAIMERLDDVCGPANWRNEYAKGPEGGVLCCIYIKIGEEWVGKWDGADNTDVEATKGGLSDAMKRAAVQWGIGRYLYDLGETWAEIVEQKTPGAIYAKSDKVGTFYWLPPKNALPVAAPQGSPEADTRRKSDDATADKFLREIAAASNLDDLSAIGTVVAEAKKKGNGYLRGRIENEVKPAWAKAAEKFKQPATNAA